MNIENLRNVLKSQFINSKVYVNIFLNHIKNSEKNIHQVWKLL